MYKLITTKKGQVPIDKIQEGTEVLCMGEWKKSPKPVLGTCLKCSFQTLPTTTFEKTFVTHKREVSICHAIILQQTKEFMPELSIRGYFKENKKSMWTVFKGTEDIPYWVPRFIRLYDEPIMPFITAIGFNLYHSSKKFGDLQGEELTERNLEYILEGMTRRSFCYDNGKYHILPINSWTETIRITMRLLDIECDVFKDGICVVKNPISFYRHIKDEYTKKKIKDEDIVYNLKKSTTLPLYTNGHKILKKEEVQDWILSGINPDINCINPLNCYEEGFTKKKWVWADPVKDGREIGLLKNNFFSQFQNN